MRDEETELRSWLVSFAKKRPRYGYRRAHAILGKEGWKVNRKRVQRLWREEGLKVTHKAKKRSRTGNSDTDAKRLQSEYSNHVWAIDYQDDQTADGRKIRLLNIVDEFTREVLATHVVRSITADKTGGIRTFTARLEAGRLRHCYQPRNGFFHYSRVKLYGSISPGTGEYQTHLSCRFH